MRANVGRPRLPIKKQSRESAEAEGKYIRQSGGRGQYGHVWLRVEPKERGKGFEFIDEIKGGIIPQNIFRRLKKELKKQWKKEFWPAIRWLICR